MGVAVSPLLMSARLELQLKRHTEGLSRCRIWADKILLRVLLKFKQTLFCFLLRREGIFLELLLEQERFLLINTRLDRWFAWAERKVLSLSRQRLENPSRASEQGGNDSQDWGSGLWPQTWRCSGAAILPRPIGQITPRGPFC